LRRENKNAEVSDADDIDGAAVVAADAHIPQSFRGRSKSDVIADVDETNTIVATAKNVIP